VTDVGNEIAAHALDSPQLRDITHESGRADRAVATLERHGADPDNLTRRAEQLELALSTLAPQRKPEQLADRVLDQGVSMAGVAEAFASGVPQQLLALGVDDDDAVLGCVQRSGERFALDVRIRSRTLRVRRGGPLRDALQVASQRPYRE
jgi:hypothetical protein